MCAFALCALTASPNFFLDKCNLWGVYFCPKVDYVDFEPGFCISDSFQRDGKY